MNPTGRREFLIEVTHKSKAVTPLKNDLGHILLADDDPDDRLLIRMAMTRSGVSNPLDCVNNGEEALKYLSQRGRYAHAPEGFPPAIVFLDLNMPKKNGFETLHEIRAIPALNPVPVVFFSTSSNPEDIYKAYGLGADAYLIKPASFLQMVEMVKSFKKFWFSGCRGDFCPET